MPYPELRARVAEVQDRIADEIIRTTGGSIGKLRGRWAGLDGVSDRDIQNASNKTFSDIPAIDPSVEKYIDGLKSLRLDALASGMDEWNQKIVQSAQSIGVSREEVEKYIAAVTTGNIQNVPKVFQEIADAQQKAAENSLWKNLQDLEINNLIAPLSDVDQELVNIAKSAGLSGPALMEIVRALQSGDTEKLPEVLRQTREQLEKSEWITTAKDAFKGFFSDFYSSLRDGESAWDAFKSAAVNALDKIAQKLIDMALDQMINNLFQGLGGLFGGGGVQLFPGGYGTASSNGFASMLGIASAKGNTFSSAGISAYSNTVVTKPTFFPFAKGIGLMGEKKGSPGEAIMPLTRMANGDLGVGVVANNNVPAAANGNINIQVNNYGEPAEATVNQTTDADGTRNIEVILEKKIRDEVTRPSAKTNRSLRGTFGLSNQVVTR